jgi:hypothetical protein
VHSGAGKSGIKHDGINKISSAHFPYMVLRLLIVAKYAYNSSISVADSSHIVLPTNSKNWPFVPDYSH